MHLPISERTHLQHGPRRQQLQVHAPPKVDELQPQRGARVLVACSTQGCRVMGGWQGALCACRVCWAFLCQLPPLSSNMQATAVLPAASTALMRGLTISVGVQADQQVVWLDVGVQDAG